MVKLARSGSVPGAEPVHSVSDRDPDDLIDGQQRVYLLLDAGRGAGAQDAAAQHCLFDLEVGGLDLVG